MLKNACGRMRFSGPVRTFTVGDPWSVGTGEPTDTNPEIISSVALSKRGVKEDDWRWKKLGETGPFAHVRAWDPMTLKRKLAKGPFHFLGHEILPRRRENLFMTELSLLRHSILVLWGSQLIHYWRWGLQHWSALQIVMPASICVAIFVSLYLTVSIRISVPSILAPARCWPVAVTKMGVIV